MSTAAPPGDVYLDTSVVVAAIATGSRHSGPCAAYCDALIAASSRVYFSQILRLEFSQAVRKLATRAEDLPGATREAFRLDRWGDDAGVRQVWLSFAVRQLDALLGRFHEAYEPPFDLDVWKTSLDIMGQHGLQSLDAVHVATARRLGLVHLATVDDHFRRVSSEFDVLLIRDGIYP